MKEHLRPVSKKMIKFAEKHSMRCYWCGTNVRTDVNCMHPLAPSKEHLIPKAIKGKGSDSAYALAHFQCNNLRGIANAEAYKRLMDGDAVTKYELWPEIFRLI
jgi:hypothetical protein